MPPLRRAGPRDRSRLSALWSVLLQHHAALDPAFALRPDSAADVEALLAAQLADPDVAVFVWDEPGAPVGFCSVRVSRAPLLQEAARAEITEVAVRPERRRGGVGRALVAAAAAWARERGAARVEARVAARNDQGQAFWRALGYADFVDVLHRHL
jgi:GNAT superfamily N-acetyltransferase